MVESGQRAEIIGMGLDDAVTEAGGRTGLAKEFIDDAETPGPAKDLLMRLARSIVNFDKKKAKAAKK